MDANEYKNRKGWSLCLTKKQYYLREGVINITISGLIGHIGVGLQSAMLEEADLATMTPTIDTFYVVTQESLIANAPPLLAENEIGRGRDRTGAVAGGYGISGGFGGYSRVSDIGKLCQMALSDDDAACSPSGSTGISTVVPTDYLDWWTVEKNVGDTLYLWLVNCKMNNLTVSVSQNAIATYTTDWVATMEKKVTSGDSETPVYTDDDLLAFHGGLLKLGGTQYNNMESVEIAIANGLSNDEYTVQPSRFLNNVTEGARTIDLNFNQVFQTADDYANYTYGAVGRTTPGYTLYEDDVYFLLMNAQIKATATQYIEFFLPRVMFGGLPVALTSGRVTVSNTGTVLVPATGDIMTVFYK